MSSPSSSRGTLQEDSGLGRHCSSSDIMLLDTCYFTKLCSRYKGTALDVSVLPAAAAALQHYMPVKVN